MGNEMQDPETEIISETASYLAWRVEEPDGEVTYHLQLNNLTVHFFQEEWDEFVDLARQLLEAD